jgi:hypothetical protein
MDAAADPDEAARDCDEESSSIHAALGAVSYPAVSAACNGGLELRCLLIKGNGLILNLLLFFLSVLPFCCCSESDGCSVPFPAVPLEAPLLWPQFNETALDCSREP